MLDVMKKRRSCRNFDASRPVEEEKIEEIIQAGLLAPSGMNRQTSVIIAIRDRATRDALMELNRAAAGGRWADMDPFYGAPVVLLVIADKNGLSIHDGAATMENILLEAANQGLASCWIHRAQEEIENPKGRELLAFTGLNFDDYVGVGHVILGYPLDDSYREKVIKENRVYRK